MKKLKTNILMIAALAIGAVTMSFKMADTQWHYTSTSTAPGAFADVQNWDEGAGSGCGQIGTKPCQLTTDASNETELAAFLNGLSNDDVMDIVDSKRN